ncbi:MAG: Hsp20/alpha crystallin family protein [bacterium]|nr:Hsp20/alpha crystallin family protein [bacterium]
MSSELVPSSAWSFPLMRFSSLMDDDSWLKQSSVPSGLSITEDEEYVYIDAALPGVKTDDIDISYHNGILRVIGEVKDEDKQSRKSYHKMTSAFSYQIAVPGEVDLNADPEASCADGVLTVAFPKTKASTPKKIMIKTKIGGGKSKASAKTTGKSESEIVPNDGSSMTDESGPVNSVISDSVVPETVDEVKDEETVEEK